MLSREDSGRRRREQFVIIVLTTVFGLGAFLFLGLITGWLFVSVLTAIAIMVVVGGMHYALWGRGTPPPSSDRSEPFQR